MSEHDICSNCGLGRYEHLGTAFTKCPYPFKGFFGEPATWIAPQQPQAEKLETFRKLVTEQGTDNGRVDVPRVKDLLKYERNKTIDECIRKVNEVLIGHSYVEIELLKLKQL